MFSETHFILLFMLFALILVGNQPVQIFLFASRGLFRTLRSFPFLCFQLNRRISLDKNPGRAPILLSQFIFISVVNHADGAALSSSYAMECDDTSSNTLEGNNCSFGLNSGDLGAGVCQNPLVVAETEAQVN